MPVHRASLPCQPNNTWLIQTDEWIHQMMKHSERFSQRHKEQTQLSETFWFNLLNLVNYTKIQLNVQTEVRKLSLKTTFSVFSDKNTHLKMIKSAKSAAFC